MRVILTILVSAVVGTAVGASMAYVGILREGEAPSRPMVMPVAPGDQSGPHVVVDEPDYDFGAMQRGTKRSHEFVFHNPGTAPLLLQVGATSCKCTLGAVPDEPVPPGGSLTVQLEWRALVSPGPFRQTAEIKTNDPRRPRVILTVSGRVTEATGVQPSDIVFDKMRYGDEKSADVYVMSMVDSELEVSDPEFSDPDISQYFAVEIQPADRAALPDPMAKAGFRVRVTTKPGLPLGRFDQWLALTTNMKDAEKLEIPIFGRVVGGVTISGRGWDDDHNVLHLGTVKSSEGAKAELKIITRDEAAGDATYEVASCDPPELGVSVGEPKRLNKSLVYTPVTIEVPAGTRPMVRLNTSQGDDGRVVLKSTLPGAPELIIKVRFAVQR